MVYDLTLSSLVQVLLPWGLIMGCWRQSFFTRRREAPALDLAFPVDLLVDFQCNLFYQVLFLWWRDIARQKVVTFISLGAAYLLYFAF